MSETYSIPLTALVKEFRLEVVYASADYESIRLTVEDVARPGLQLTGYFEHFEPMRLQILGNVEFSFIQKKTPQERAAIFDKFFSYKPPALLIARNFPVDEQVLAMAKSAGIDVPRELAVVAVDNDARICEHTVPTLSSVQQDMWAAGFLAAKLLDARLANPRKRLESVRFGLVGLVRRASSSRGGCGDRRVAMALEFIRVHACEGISSADVAAQFDCSRRFLDRVFARVTGRTLLAEIQRVQVEAVRQVLRQSPAMKQYALADACGFASPEDLRRVFKKVTGLTIGAWLKARTQDVTVGLF